MKLGIATNSLTNHLMAKGAKPAPAVGMAATILWWTDRHAATIVEIKGSRVGVRRDKAIRVDGNGMSDAQGYRYEPNPDARIEWYSLRKSGEYVAIGSSDGNRLAIGLRNEYHDFSF